MSIYGIAWPGLAPTIISPGAPVTLTAGAETTIVATSATLVGVPNQDYIVLVVGCCVVLMGAAAPSALVIAARYAGGADFDTQTVDTGLLTNAATIEIPIVLVGANVRAAANGNVGSGAVQVTGNSTTQNSTARATSTKFAVLLIPGPDL